jgi:hypothetical protein
MSFPSILPNGIAEEVLIVFFEDTQSKINHFDTALGVVKDVIWFDIHMDDGRTLSMHPTYAKGKALD